MLKVWQQRRYIQLVVRKLRLFTNIVRTYLWHHRLRISTRNFGICTQMNFNPEIHPNSWNIQLIYTVDLLHVLYCLILNTLHYIIHAFASWAGTTMNVIHYWLWLIIRYNLLINVYGSGLKVYLLISTPHLTVLSYFTFYKSEACSVARARCRFDN